jgi:hypothetical protein
MARNQNGFIRKQGKEGFTNYRWLFMPKKETISQLSALGNELARKTGNMGLWIKKGRVHGGTVNRF